MFDRVKKKFICRRKQKKRKAPDETGDSDETDDLEGDSVRSRHEGKSKRVIAIFMVYFRFFDLLLRFLGLGFVVSI